MSEPMSRVGRSHRRRGETNEDYIDRMEAEIAALIEAAKDVLKHDSLGALGRLEDAVREAERRLYRYGGISGTHGLEPLADGSPAR